MTTAEALELVAIERERQRRKWGETAAHRPHLWVTMLVEEVGELARSIHDQEFAPTSERWSAALREAIHVAAVAVQIAERVNAEAQREAQQLGCEAVAGEAEKAQVYAE